MASRNAEAVDRIHRTAVTRPAVNRVGLYGHNDNAFGHSDWGGSIGFADPASRRGIAYTVNRMGSALNGDPDRTTRHEAIDRFDGAVTA